MVKNNILLKTLRTRRLRVQVLPRAPKNNSGHVSAFIKSPDEFVKKIINTYLENKKEIDSDVYNNLNVFMYECEIYLKEMLEKQFGKDVDETELCFVAGGVVYCMTRENVKDNIDNICCLIKKIYN